jgi:hypothetical protein
VIPGWMGLMVHGHTSILPNSISNGNSTILLMVQGRDPPPHKPGPLRLVFCASSLSEAFLCEVCLRFRSRGGGGGQGRWRHRRLVERQVNGGGGSRDTGKVSRLERGHGEGVEVRVH